jgi:POT family proton-dependent oligopeptide transporter
MIGFWTMYNQLFYTLPNFIEDWIDTSILSNWVNENIPFLSKTITQDGQVKAEWFANLDAFMIIILQIAVSYFVIKMRHINAIIRGAIIATIGVSLTFYTHNVWFTVFGTMIFAIGEMMSSPTLSSFIALITPKGKEGLYQGTYFLPVAAGNFFTGFIAGDLYQKWSDKLSILQTEMSKRNISMPEVVSKEEFIEQGSKALNLSISEFEKQFHLKDANLDYAAIGTQFKELATIKGIDVSRIQTPFSKNEYFALASQKLNMTHWEMTDMLWNSYSPNKIWYVVCAVGLVSIVALIIYDQFVVKPLEKKVANPL